MQDYQILLCEDFHVEEDMTQDRYNFDGTGKITTNDAHILMKYIANPSSVTSAQKRKIEAEYGGFKAGDINRDGIINNLDANLLLKFASGIINEETADIKNFFFKEKPVCEIGSSSSNFPGKAIDPIFYTKIDGTHELKFSIPSVYFDEDSGEMKENEIIRNIANKDKIRLKKKNNKTGEYDFYSLVVNNKIDKDSNGILSYEYTCTDAFIEELSKTGYGLVFSDDMELGNGLGTIHELAEKVLEDSDWIYRQDKTGTLLEYTTDLQYNIEQGRYDTVYKPVPVHPIKYVKQLKRYCNKLDPNLIKDGKQYYCYEDTHQVTSNTVQNLLYNSNEPVDIVGWTTYKKNEENTKILPGYMLEPFDAKWDGNDEDEKPEMHFGIHLTKPKGMYAGTYLLNDTCASSNTIIKANQPYLFRFTTIQPDPPTGSASKGYDARVRAIHIYNQNPLLGAKIEPVYKWSLGTGADSGGKYHYFKPGERYVLKTNVSIANPYFVLYISVPEPKGTAEDFYFYTMNLYEIKGKETKNANGDIIATAEENNLKLLSELTDKMTLSAGNEHLKIMCGLLTSSVSAYTEKKILYFYIDGDEEDEDAIVKYVNFKDIYNSTKISLSPKKKEDREKEIKAIDFDAMTEQEIDEFRKAELTTIYYSPDDKRYYQYYLLTRNGQTNGTWELALYGDGANDKRRTLVAEKSNRFNLLQELAELFKAWCVFNITEREDGTLKKEIWFKENAINQNFAGFHKGVNLQSLERESNSDNIVTKLFVEAQENNYAENGLVTITTSNFNPWGENFFYNFKYYVDQQFFTRTIDADGAIQLKVDYDLKTLYSNVRSKNDLLFENNEKLVQLKVDLSNLSNQQKSLAYSIASITERLTSLKAELGNSKVSEPDKKKTRSTIKTYEDQQENYQNKIDAIKLKIEALESNIELLEDENEVAQSSKKAYIRAFEREYAPYIKEGVWSDSSYVDNDTYLLDAQKISNTSVMPQTDWTISVLDGSVIEDLENYVFEVGDQTFLIDNDFFKEKNRVKEHRFEVLISGIEEHLDNGLENKIEVRNYLTSFEDLFQRISAATQTVELKEHIYDKAEYFTSEHQIDQGILQNTLLNNSLILSNSSDNSYTLDNTGLSLQSVINPSKKVRLVADGLFFSNSLNLTTGEPEWKTGITAEGINASMLTAGEINTSLIKIYDGIHPTFTWSDLGITAYQDIAGKTFVRLDSYGLYLVENDDGFTYADNLKWDEGKEKSEILDQIVSRSTFSLTERGLRLNLDVTGGNGSIQLGYLNDSNDDYGLTIKNSSNQEIVKLTNTGVNTIAGWIITESSIYQKKSSSENGYDDLFGMQYRAGNESLYNAIAIGRIKNTATTWTNAQFRVTNDGVLHATGAIINGEITADTGEIGGWTISNTVLESTQNGYRIYMASGSNGAGYWIKVHPSNNMSDCIFGVTRAGKLEAKGVDIEGNVSLQTGRSGIYFSPWEWTANKDPFAQLEFKDSSTTHRTGIIADYSNSKYNYHINYIYPSGSGFNGKAAKIFSIKMNGAVAELTFDDIYTHGINTDIVHLTPSGNNGRGTGYNLIATDDGFLKFGSHRVGHATTLWSGDFYSGANERITVENGVITSLHQKLD